MPTTTGRRLVLDAQCAAAVDLARAALAAVTADDHVGEHLGTQADGERVVTHLFDCLLPGYRGWRWAVTVARASRARTVTIDETVLLPGPDALLAPQWLPWTERLQAGDLGVGDLLPAPPDDDRLEPGWNAAAPAGPLDEPDGPDLWSMVGDLGLRRPRVLSPIGFDDAVDRWYSGENGPHSPMALAAPATCATCGFRLPVLGRIGAAFSICANEYSPSDGQAVSMDHGCGAHSQVRVDDEPATGGEPVVDELGFDHLGDDEELGHG